MGLIGKIFGGAREAGSESRPAPPFADSDSSGMDEGKREASRRDLVHAAMRETMRKHGIPSDWMACRVLSVMSRSKKRPGLHVQFVVRKGDEQLLRYVHAFQAAFVAEVEKADPAARQWIFSIAWQFEGEAPASRPAALTPAAQAEEQETVPEAGDTVPQVDDAVDLESDLQALYAIRDAAIAKTGQPPALKDGERVPS